MDWKGIKCEYCHQNLRCQTCNQLFPHLSLVSEKFEDRGGNEITVYFCNHDCRDKWMENRKRERRT